MLDKDFVLIKDAIRKGMPLKLKTKIPLEEVDTFDLWDIAWEPKDNFKFEIVDDSLMKVNYRNLERRIKILEEIQEFIEKNFLDNTEITMFFSGSNTDSPGLGWHRDRAHYVFGLNLIGESVWESQGFDPIGLKTGEMILMPEPVTHRVIVKSEERITCGFYGKLKKSFA